MFGDRNRARVLILAVSGTRACRIRFTHHHPETEIGAESSDKTAGAIHVPVGDTAQALRLGK